ncbi:LytR/AlgR family response regulator transcription factor [Tepidibacter hydrothermalis]|uniref:Stage 0 sporulation protein A homolog n=1 Tax=Tepidibacter hydrothermalis TaxID=3036126 RepID=A0ABY8ECV9_9FIRM|nr:LytTR family DNA-binding domain-containing protein [Tepidibacter hydrothermalis]WFD10773.1 LytTR family DNA-binding domain-containing protein [Tepidibacter hydrothermalis]
MINFIICEDNQDIRNEILSIVKSYASNKNYEFNIGLINDSSEGVIEYIKNNLDKKNVYILDIELKNGTNGMELAKNIRKYDQNGEIIFVTNHSIMLMYIFKYKLKALDFIDKSENIKFKLEENLDVIYENLCNKKKDVINFKCGSRSYVLNFDEIINFEMTGVNHKIRVSTLNGQYEFYTTLKEIEKKLDDRFYRSHRACILNKDYIQVINNSKNDMYIVMKNGQKSLLSRKYAKGLIENAVHI